MTTSRPHPPGDALDVDLFDDDDLDAILIISRERRVAWMNGAARELLGGGPAVAEALERAAALHPSAEGAPGIRGRLGRGEVVTGEATITLADGRRIHVEQRAKLRADGTVRVVLRDITARFEAENALREREARYRGLAEALHEGVITYDAAGRITETNPRADEILGVRAGEAIGHRAGDGPWSFLASDGTPIAVAELPSTRALATGERVTGVLVGIQRRDGAVTWVTKNAVPRLDADGRPCEVLVSLADVTDLRQALDAAAASEARVRMLVEAARDGVIVVDRDDRVEWLNPAAAEIWGRSLAEVTGRPFAELLDPSDAVDHAVADVAVRAGRVVQRERRITRPDGSHRWIETRPTLLPDGRIEGILRDVTDRKTLEAERERLVRAVEHAFDAIQVTDAAGQVVYVNAAFERMVGRPREELVGQYGPVHAADHERGEVEATVGAALETHRWWTGDLEVTRPDGTRTTAAFRVARVDDDRGEVLGYIATAHDPTYERSLEAKLAEAAKVEAIGQLAGGVAHDFNNLLTVILGHAELAADTVADLPDAKQDLAEIVAAAVRGQALTRQLLAFGRRSMLQPRDVVLADVAAGLDRMLRRLVPEDLELRVSIASRDLVRVDPAILEHALVNLIVNARDALGTGGRIELVVGRPHADDGVPADWAAIRVRDNGSGMSPDVLARVFEPFFTTKGVGKGTGLGLSMVQGFVEQSGGRLRVESAVGVGTTVSILLPTVQDPERPSVPNSEPEERRPGGVVLVVEDEPTLRLLAERTLTRGGYTTVVAASAADALDLAGRMARPVDLLFTDVVMPGMNGLALATELRRRWPDLRVLIASGYTPDEVARRGSLDAETRFLEKPYAPSTLLAAVADLLDPSRTEPVV